MNDYPIDFLLSIVPVFIIVVLYYLIRSICLWRIFEKANKPQWAAFVPVYYFIVLLEITEKPMFWVALLFFPLISIFIPAFVYVKLATQFDKSPWFGVGMFVLPFIFFPILAFGDAPFNGQKQIFYDDDVLDRG